MLDVGANYGHGQAKWKLGWEGLDTQLHMLHCTKLDDNDIVQADKTYKYEDLFSSKVED